MKPPGMPLRAVLILSVCVSGSILSFAVSSPDAESRSSSCLPSEYHSLDFWVGDWDVFDANHPETAVAHARIDSILGGCAIHEDYRDPSGMHGESFSIYDPSRKVWHQTWVTNRGRLLVIEGQAKRDEVELKGMNRTSDGKDELVRGLWKPATEGVRETAWTSLDGGKSWTPWFDLIFRHPEPSAQTEDQKTVEALDLKYQAAVKANDAATMDQILADDFILSTGSGKTYTKADLLADAKSGKTTYIHEDDTNRTVRVWGNTAVITARLWEQGTDDGKPFDHLVWFSDTYVRSPAGWRYVFGQSSLPLPSSK